MRAVKLFSPAVVQQNPLSLVSVDVPEPAAGQVRIKINYCGVCHTDLHIVEGDIHPPQLPITPGHQVVGVIDAIGPSQAEVGLRAGQRVGVPWLHWTDGTCAFCDSGSENLCERAKFTGFHVDGGYADYMIAESQYVLPLPQQIQSMDAAPLLCAGIVGFRSLRKAGLVHGERLGLFGFGASAHLAIQVARSWGCEVYVFTRSASHRKHAEKLGAAWVGGAEDKPPKLLDRAVVFAPAGKIVPLALEKIRAGGTVALNAIHMSDIPQMPYSLIYGERSLVSVANATYQDGLDFLELAAEIPIKVTRVPYKLENANRALADMKHSRINGEAVLEINSD
ncbi:MAG: zinc-dependent alcohol dehydrogenase family protein [Anaerolineales bacterium]